MMRVYPQRRVGNMMNQCTCGLCQETHVRRESNTARVYKVQLPPLKTRKPNNAGQPKVISGQQSGIKRKPKPRKAVHKSVVRSKPEYDSWYFSDADLKTIAHSNMQNYLSRFQPDVLEAATQTMITCGRQDLAFASMPSVDKAVQFGVSSNEVENGRQKDRGDCPSKDAPVALSAILNYEQAAGDFVLEDPMDNVRLETNNRVHKNSTCNEITSKPTRKISSGNIIEMPPAPDLREFEPYPSAYDLKPEIQSKSKRLYNTQPHDFDRLLEPDFSRKLRWESDNHIKGLMERGKSSRPTDNKMALQHKHRASKIENAKIPRKLLETSLRKEKEARKLLKTENARLTNCISKAEQKVREMRLSLSELSCTIKQYKAKGCVPYGAKVEQLEKLVDDLIREFRSGNAGKPADNLKDIRANCVVIATGPECSGHVGGVTKQEEGCRKDRKFDWSSLSGISSVSVGTSSSADTSLTALKNELGKFFEDMREDTEKLIEEAELHHVALTSCLGRTSSSTSYGSSFSSLTRYGSTMKLSPGVV